MLLLIKRRLKIRKQLRKRQFWIRKLFLERQSKGALHQLTRDLKLFDSESFFKYYGLITVQLEEIPHLVAPYIKKDSTRWEPIRPAERPSVTLRYLETGYSQISYRISPTTVS